MDLAAIAKDLNYTNANPATKAAIFDKYAAQDANYTKANPATQAAIRVKFGVEGAAPEPKADKGPSMLAQFGEGLASLADNTVGAIIPGAVGIATYAGSRAMGRSPVDAARNEAAVAKPMEQPFGKLFGVTNTAGYKGEISSKVADFIGANVSKGVNWLSKSTGLPAEEIGFYLQTLSTAAAPEAGRMAGGVAGKLAKPVVNAMAERGAPVVQAAQNRLAAMRAGPSDGHALTGGGAMDTTAATQRLTTAEGLRRPLQLTKGQITRDPAQLRFESDTRKTHADSAGRPLVDRDVEQNQDILANFDAYTGATGAERAGKGQLRPVGTVVDKALVKYAGEKKAEIDKAYTAARANGEMQEPVSYIGLSNYIDQQSPTVRKKLAPILQAVREELRANDPHATGSVPINALEDIRQAINKNTQPGTPNAVHARELKGLIDDATADAGGDLYKAARQKRIQYAREFENVGAVDKLLRHKPGTTDRAVAVEDIFDHAILKGSLDDTMAIGRTLKKAGPEGQQAWKELQGQTIEHIKEQVTKSVARDKAGNPYPSPARFDSIMREMDADGKLDYIFGKQGAQELRDLNATVQAAYTAPPGTINFSNNAGQIVAALEKLQGSIVGKIPGVRAVAGHVAEKSRARDLAKKVEDALYPNAPEPDAIGNPPPRKAPAMRQNKMAPANTDTNAMNKGRGK